MFPFSSLTNKTALSGFLCGGDPINYIDPDEKKQSVFQEIKSGICNY